MVPLLKQNMTVISYITYTSQKMQLHNVEKNVLRRGQEEVGVVFNAQSHFLSHGFLLRIGNTIAEKKTIILLVRV